MTTPLEGPEPHGDRAEVVQAQVQALWLQDMWSFYFHDPEDPSWTLESYRRLGDVASVEELWEMVEATGKHAHAGMFFAMREHVFPCWDDANNIDGGCVSIKVPADAARATWETLVKRALGETLVVERPMWASLNGISVSPKRGFCILKIWMADTACTGSIREYFRLPPEYRGEVVFRLNRENMQMDARKADTRQSQNQSQASASGMPSGLGHGQQPPCSARSGAPTSSSSGDASGTAEEERGCAEGCAGGASEGGRGPERR